ncbi:pantoate--beta-alanine ligase [candidate division BRC1 bacterium HGW-BRC1-1]|jgi:pantoate--beta-alanine ligase|nr:MAG: pantoate--beta-alanine ligase [candidate division BRC1 bacterium HGW-BRC1-1]
MTPEIYNHKSDLREVLAFHRAAGKSVGLVPTMGFLHEGHGTLIRHAAQSADVVVVSIFVNPLQFGPSEDLARYPRDLSGDVALSGECGAHLIFAPTAEDFTPADMMMQVKPGAMATALCGRSRPGHFDGVCTIVAKLFNVVQPDFAFFGWKDAQQFLILKRMVADLDFAINMVAVETVRESDGLAMSSRNSYLTQKERDEAPTIQGALAEALRLVAQDGELRCDYLIDAVKRRIREGTRSKIDYVEIVSLDGLRPLDRVEPGNTLLAVAVQFPSARLIDNVRF